MGSDIKPANIMYTTENNSIFIDFGLMKKASSRLEQNGGTAYYIPDEIGRKFKDFYYDKTPGKDKVYYNNFNFVGGSRQTSHDVFSLGVTLYVLICGQEMRTSVDIFEKGGYDLFTATEKQDACKQCDATSTSCDWGRKFLRDFVIVFMMSPERARLGAGKLYDYLNKYLNYNPG